MKKKTTLICALCVWAAGTAGAQTTYTIYDAGVGPATDPLLDAGWGSWDASTGTPIDFNGADSTTGSGAAAWEFGDALMGGGQGDAMYYDFDEATVLEMVNSPTGFEIAIEIESVGTGGFISLGDASNVLGGGSNRRYGGTPGATGNPPGVETLTFTFPNGGPLSNNYGAGSGGSSGNWLGGTNELRLNLADNSSSSSLMHFKLVSLKVTYTPGGTPPTPDFEIGGDTSGGTPDVTDTANWTTNSVAFIQDSTVGVDDGYILDWENVTQTASVDVVNGGFDGTANGGPNYTNGILYMYTAESVDLSTLSAGITRLGFSGTFTSDSLENWIPVMAITNGGTTRYYRSNNTGNSWSGSGSLKVFFSDLGVISGTDFAGLVPAGGTITGINGTRDLSDTPVLRPEYEWNFGTQMWELVGAPTGVVTFGFIQWGSSSSGSVAASFDTTVQTFEITGFSDEDDIVEPDPPQGLASTGVDSSTFTYKYEMDVDPTNLDLDSNTFSDWFTGVSGGGTHPMTYVGGIAYSNQDPSAPAPDVESFTITRSGDDAILNWTLSSPGAVDVETTDDLGLGFVPFDTVPSGTTTWTDTGVGGIFDKYFYRLVTQETVGTPEVLFRNDASNTLIRDTLFGSDFTVEVRARVIGPKDGGDVGIFGIAIDPGGAASALRMQVDLTDVSQNGDATDLVATGANDDAMHTYRIAYIHADDYYFVWRDGVMIYGANTDIGIHGTNGGFSNAGATWFGDFSSGLSGEWEVDYIRFEASAVGP